MMIWLILAVMVCLSAGISEAATTYYLNPATGSDGAAGTATGTAWKTLQKVKTSTGAGDIVNVLGGTYTPSQYKGTTGIPSWSESQSHGTLGNPLTIQANPGDTVIFDGAGESYWMNIVGATTTDRHLIIQNLTFQNYAGAVIAVEIANYVAVQNCRFLNNTFGGSPLATQKAGHIIFRNNIIDAVGSHGIYISEGTTFSLLSGNRVLGAGDLPTAGSGTAFGIHFWGHFDPAVTQNVIVRNNVVVNALTGTWIIAGATYTNIYIYNNTLYQDSSHQTTYGIFSTHNGGAYNHFIVKNNIGDGYATPANVISDPGQTYTGLALDYNLWRNQSGAPLYYWNGSTYTLSQFQTTLGYETHSLNVNPLFTNPAIKDFTLQTSSPAINAGSFLTTTVGSGTASTTVTVADAGFFMDGFNLIPGDMVQIGGNSPVQITGVNYGANTITVTPSISWSNGQGVSLPYSGSAPDIGASEYTSASATKVKLTTQPVTTIAGAVIPNFVAQIQDNGGTLVPSATNTVTITLSGGLGFLPGTTALITELFTTSKVGRYVKIITLADNNGSNSASAAEINILNNGSVIPQGGISVVSVSSQETSSCCGGPRLIGNAFDGNTATYWYTQYTGGKLGPPYTLILDLGSTYTVNGWKYLSHQVDDPDGVVTKYEFYVSTDGVTWGTALTSTGLTGTLSRAAIGGIATFNDVVIGSVWNGYKFTATASGLTSDTSSTFDIVNAGVQQQQPGLLMMSIPGR
jgi:hypothetical protein